MARRCNVRHISPRALSCDLRLGRQGPLTVSLTSLSPSPHCLRPPPRRERITRLAVRVDCTAGTIRGTGPRLHRRLPNRGTLSSAPRCSSRPAWEQKSDHVQVRAGDARLALPPLPSLLATCRAATDVGQRVLSASGVGRSCRVDAALRPFSRNSRFRSTALLRRERTDGRVVGRGHFCSWTASARGTPYCGSITLRPCAGTRPCCSRF